MTDIGTDASLEFISFVERYTRPHATPTAKIVSYIVAEEARDPLVPVDEIEFSILSESVDIAIGSTLSKENMKPFDTIVHQLDYCINSVTVMHVAHDDGEFVVESGDGCYTIFERGSDAAQAAALNASVEINTLFELGMLTLKA